MVSLSNILNHCGLFQGRSLPVIQLAYSEQESLVFGQQHIGTQDFFRDRLGQYHTVPLLAFPHFQFLDRWLEDPFSPDNPYMQYLSASWAFHFGHHRNTIEARRAKATQFVDYFRRSSQGHSLVPIRVCRRPDGKLIIVDGNHRAAIAHRLGRNLLAEEISLAQYLTSVSRVPHEFYGTNWLGKPYQSVLFRGKELVNGRRQDAYDRINLVMHSDLQGKSVLDLGCNLGMSGYLAAERGAANVVGIEGSARLSTAAIRMNAIFAAPCYFIHHDLNRDIDVIKHDTVFCFSLFNHITRRDALIRTIDKAVGKTLYFEGHAHTTHDTYSAVLNTRRFSRIQLLGFTSDGIHTSHKSRPLWRCEL